MQHTMFGRQVGPRIGEVHGISLPAAMTQTRAWKVGFTAFVVVIQVDKEGDETLPMSRDLAGVAAISQ